MSETTNTSNLEGAFQIDKDKKKTLETKSHFIAWIKAHKKELVLAGIGITTIIGIILGINNRQTIMKLWSSLANSIKRTPASGKVPILASQATSSPTISINTVKKTTRAYALPTKAFKVRGHIRTMPVGKHHSIKKAAEAAALGIVLLPNQTLVNSYPKYVA